MARLPVAETHRQQVIDQPVRLIELGDSGTRSQASRALLVWGTAEQVPFLLRQLDTADNFAIDDVTAALGELGDARAVKPLVQLIRDSSGKRGGCAKVHDAGEALAKLGPIVEDEVLSLLIDEDEDVVDTACDVLRECGTSKSITPLTKLVRSASWKDSYKMSTERAISAIKRRGLHGVLSGPARKKRLAQSTHAGQSQANPNHICIEKSLSILNNETEPTSKVLQALNELAKCHPSESHRDQVASLLVPYLKNTKRTSNTKTAIRALAVWGNASHAPELERLLPLAKFRSTQEIIFSALGEIGDETTAARMLPFLKRADYGYLATQAFHRLDSNVEDELISLLSSSDLYLRARVAAALGRAGSEKAEIALSKQLEHESDSVAQKQAIQALARLRVAREKL